ncbi:hypothetical protein [Actinomadura chibensis]|uniref:Uncharacterized protein n=1 Tax=Actinomadura chibensis TaxID=392828 RepID=A0A5D0NVH6_9ACTN|nr:hypothetical protein [Actinomadura chibensis]TYB48690.1 hypothetical protein FXF69_05810 [Actinomadura chibensis]
MTADEVSALRSVLVGDLDTHHQIYDRLDPNTQSGYLALVMAAFFTAAERRFKDGNKAEVAAFVGRVRGRSDRMADAVDPHIAERLLLAVSTGADIDDIDAEARGGHFILLLTALVVESDLSSSEMDAFLDDARKLADEWLADDPR